MRQICPKLSSIVLVAEDDDDWHAYAGLICSYGAQLRDTNINDILLAECERITMSCPNLRCHLGSSDGAYGLEMTDAAQLLEKMSILGSCVNSIYLTLKTTKNPILITEQMVATLRLYSQLEKIGLYAGAGDAMRAVSALFSKSLTVLTSLTLDI